MRLGDVKIYQHKLTRTQVAMKEFKANSKEEITQYQQKFNQRSNLDHPNIASAL